jgi:hypothetical protein
VSDQSSSSPQGYVQLAFTLDTDALVQTGLDHMASRIDGWEAYPAEVDTVMIESAGEMAGELLDQAIEVPPEAMAFIGTTIYGIPMGEGAAASADAVMHFAADTPPVLIDQDTTVNVPHPSGIRIQFVTDRDILAPAGGGDVALTLIAGEIGAGANGAYGEGALIDPIQGLVGITVTESSGGEDAQSVEDYLDDLRNVLTLPRRPVLPSDHATVAARIPGVARAVAIDLFVPGTATNARAIRDPNEVTYFAGKTPAQGIPAANLTNEPRATTVAILADGDDPNPSDALLTQVWENLDSNREVNFLNYVVPPTFTSIDIRADVLPLPGADLVGTAAQANAELVDWLNNWSQLPFSGGEGTWIYDTVVSINEAIEHANRGLDVWKVRNVQMKRSTDPATAWAAADIALAGTAPMPQVGTITMTPVAS